MKVILRVRWDLPWIDPATNIDRFPERKTVEWQRERWRLFEKYTLPSLEAQTHRDWQAHLLADGALEDVHRDVLPSSLLDRVSIVCNPRDRAIFLAAELNDRAAFYMRIDSDDMLAPDALRMMVAEATRRATRRKLADGRAKRGIQPD